MKRGIKTLITGITLSFLGMFVFPMIFILPILFDNSENPAFIIPGSSEISVEEAGRYYLWNNYRTVFNSTTYNRPKTLPDGLEISIETSTGEILNFIPHTSISTSDPSSSRSNIGYVEIEQPCRVNILISGNAEPRVFSFSRSGFNKIFGLFAAGIILSISVSLIGGALAVWGVFKMVKSSSTKPDKHPSSHQYRNRKR